MEKFVVERIREIGKDPVMLESISQKSRAESKTINEPPISMNDLKSAFSLFDPVWEMLFPKEQTRIMQLLIERIDYDTVREILAITLSSAGIMTLSAEMETAWKEKAKKDEPPPTNR